MSDNRTPNYKCVICGKDMYVRPYRLKKQNHGFTCSKECGGINRSKWFSGEGNHQYGLKEELNSSFKSKTRVSRYGYILVHKKDHPFGDKNRMVFEHRLVIEENADLFDNKYFVVIDGKKYLSKKYYVHHKNEIRTDNRLENLQVVTAKEHWDIHSKERETIKNRKGQFYANIRKGEPIPIKIKYFNEGKQPIKKSNRATCFDCFSNIDTVIKPNETKVIPLGFGLDLPYLFEGQIRPRSGLSAKGIDTRFGSIDEDYKGEISAILFNSSNTDFVVNRYDRICQIAIQRVEKIEMEIVEELSDSERGENGFGSSGIK